MTLISWPERWISGWHISIASRTMVARSTRSRRSSIRSLVMRPMSSRSSMSRAISATCRSITSETRSMSGSAARGSSTGRPRCGPAPADCAARGRASPGTCSCGGRHRAATRRVDPRRAAARAPAGRWYSPPTTARPDISAISATVRIAVPNVKSKKPSRSAHESQQAQDDRHNDHRRKEPAHQRACGRFVLEQSHWRMLGNAEHHADRDGEHERGRLERDDGDRRHRVEDAVPHRDSR